MGATGAGIPIVSGHASMAGVGGLTGSSVPVVGSAATVVGVPRSLSPVA